MMRRMLALLGLMAMTFVLTASGAEQPAAKKGEEPRKPDKSAATVDRSDIALLQQQLLKQRFEEFKKQLRTVKEKLEQGTADDKAKAKSLENALKEIEKNRLDANFADLVRVIQTSKLGTVDEVKKALEQSKQLAEDLRKLIDILREDSKAAKLRDERKRLEEMIKELEGIIKSQKLARAITTMDKNSKQELAKVQKAVTRKTENLQRALEGKPALKDNQGREGKPGDERGKEKGKGKSGEGKEGDGKPKGPDKGDSKKDDPKAKEKGEGDQKGKGKAGASKENTGKANKSGPGKEAKSQSKAGDNKSGNKPSQGKPENKAGSKAEGESKSKGKSEGESKSQGDGKSGDAKSGEKSADSKSGGKSGQSKSGGKSGDAKSGDENPDAKSPDQPTPPQEDTADARKKIQEGKQYQKDAEAKIEDDKKKMAAKSQEEAIKALEAAKKKLEELLRQAREEELERLLTALENRCREMLEKQRLVKAATIAIDKSILANKDKKPDRSNMIESGKQAENEKKIVDLAAKAIEMIQAEGTAVAFAEVFEQVQGDMKTVQKLLEETKVDATTQTIEQEIIDQLEEMIKAFQKAKQELGQSKPGQSSPPTDPKLLDDIAQLKMIRSRQVRVNNRTKMYHRLFDPKEPEQTSNKDLKDKIKDLAGQQERLFDVTMKIAKGDNK
jgi:hypothetical protein